MSEVVTMVTATIPPERAAEVIGRFSAAVRKGMPERRQTSLLRGEGDLWRIVTVWRSRSELDAYLASVDEPFARRLFREAGGAPVVDVLNVVVDSGRPWWP